MNLKFGRLAILVGGGFALALAGAAAADEAPSGSKGLSQIETIVVIYAEIAVLIISMVVFQGPMVSTM